MKKRIALITWLGWGNYGTSLQSYSLHRTLEQMGYSVAYLYKVGVVNSLKHLCYWLLPMLKPRKEQTVAEKKLAKFDAESYHIRMVYNILPKWKLRRDFDVFMTGSDQLWNTMHYFDPFYFLSFAGRKKRVAYATSIGTNRVNEKYRKRVGGYLSSFSHIAIRETTGVSVLSELTGRTDIVQMPDPTFLMNAHDWLSFGQQAEIEFELPEKYIFAYFVGKRKEYAEMLEHVKTQYNIQHVITVPSHESGFVSLGDAVYYADAAPREFVKLLQGAALVCSDSFHAIAVSINTSTDFVVFKRFDDNDPKSQNSRMYDLLSQYHLKHRMYSSDNVGDWSGAIKYEAVQAIVEEDRQRAMRYLQNAIEH